ncbi:MAG: 50S ribosomal protein L35 [Spirochaetota bacterium]
MAKVKVKSHSGAKKRFKLSATKKAMHGKAGKRHLLSNKPTGRKKSLRGTEAVSKSDTMRVRHLLPYA